MDLQEYQKKMYGKYRPKAPCPNCVDVQKLIEIYCIICKTYHCALCQLMNHQNHKFKTIYQMMEEIRSSHQSKFLFGARFFLENEKDKLNNQTDELKKGITQQIDVIRANLTTRQKKMQNYVQTYYKRKLEETTETISKIDGLTEKYDFYLDFSESALEGKNNADLDITHLVNKELENVRKDLSDDISKLHSTNPNIYLKVKFDDTMHKFIKSVKRIITHDLNNYYEEQINEINKTADITSCPGYLDATMSEKSIPPIITADHNQSSQNQPEDLALNRNLTEIAKRPKRTVKEPSALNNYIIYHD